MPGIHKTLSKQLNFKKSRKGCGGNVQSDKLKTTGKVVRGQGGNWALQAAFWKALGFGSSTRLRTEGRWFGPETRGDISMFMVPRSQ